MRNIKKNISKIKFYMIDSAKKSEEFDCDDVLTIYFENEADKDLLKNKIRNQRRIAVLLKLGYFKVFDSNTVDHIELVETNINDSIELNDKSFSNTRHICAQVMITRSSLSTINSNEMKELLEKFNN